MGKAYGGLQTSFSQSSFLRSGGRVKIVVRGHQDLAARNLAVQLRGWCHVVLCFRSRFSLSLIATVTAVPDRPQLTSIRL